MMTRIELIKGDITRIAADAIVNAANTSLLGGGGVDGAIHRAAGPGLMKECRTLNGCGVGEVRITAGYNLPARHVIHTVGPVWHGGGNNEAFQLKSCYIHTLELAQAHQLKTIAFPNISTGVYGYPKLEAAEIAITTVKDYIQNQPSFETIFFAVFDDENYRLYHGILKGD
jgi:O-acetyl-ADP-ribose deacetylase